MRRPVHCARQRRGIAILWTLISIVLLIAFTGLAIDTVHGVLAAQQLQAASDAAALAGAARVRLMPEMTQTAAMETAQANSVAKAPVLLSPNDANDATGDIVVGRYDRNTRTFTPTLNDPNAVKVVGRRTGDAPGGPLQLLFGPIFGFDTIEIERTAIAMVDGYIDAGIIVLHPTDPCALRVQGSRTTLAVNANIHVNSSHQVAGCHAGQPLIDAPETNVTGELDNGFDSAVKTTGEINTGRYPVLDPLRNLPAPSYNPGNDLGSVRVSGNGSEVITLQPGYYSGGVEMNSTGGTLALEPGIYIFDGTGFNISGGNLLAENVLIYIVDSTPGDSQKSNLTLGGNGDMTITPPSSGIYQGVSIFQARDNTNQSSILGTSNKSITGAIYMPNNHLQIGGTGSAFGNQIIASTLHIFGTGTIDIDYYGLNPAPANHVFLVH